MPIPQFDNTGYLPSGIHLCSGEEFLERFCSSESRKTFTKTVVHILDFAKDRGARNIFVGGSFITNKENPSDIDCLIEFYLDRQIPSFLDTPMAGGTMIDILYSSAESKNLTDSFIKLLSSKKYGEGEVGLIQIQLDEGTKPWKVVFTPDGSELEIIKRFYCDRHIIDISKQRGVLVIYDKNNFQLLFNSSRRQEVLEPFRDWIYRLYCKYERRLSIICHSYGTHLIASYLDSFSDEFCPVDIDTIVLTGGIISPNFDWDRFRPKSVGRVLNIVASQDEAVKFMPNGEWKKIIGISSISGRSGLDGYDFNNKNSIVTEKKIDILNHSNIIKRDIVETIIMPFINANYGIKDLESMEEFISKEIKK